MFFTRCVAMLAMVARRAWVPAAACVAAGAVAACNSSEPAPPDGASYRAPRTADGQPDLQGAWANNTATPLQRPPAWAGILAGARAEEAAGGTNGRR